MAVRKMPWLAMFQQPPLLSNSMVSGPFVGSLFTSNNAKVWIEAALGILKETRGDGGLQKNSSFKLTAVLPRAADRKVKSPIHLVGWRDACDGFDRL